LYAVRRGNVRSVQCSSSASFAVTRIGSHAVAVCRVDGHEAAATHLSLP
jgi:hypothetical protein